MKFARKQVHSALQKSDLKSNVNAQGQTESQSCVWTGLTRVSSSCKLL